MTDVSWNTIIALAFRHLLTAAGLKLVHSGYIDASALEGFIGAGMTIGGIAWSIWQKQGQAAALSELRIMVDYWRNRNKPAGGTQGKPQ